MANPQKEHGHLEIANEIVEVLMKTDLSGGEFALIFAVIRKTWGWRKKEDWIPLSQLAEMTGFTRRYICKIKKQLVNKRTLVEVKNKLRFNKNYDEWVVSYRSPVNNSVDKTKGVVSKKTLGSELKGTAASVLKDTLNRQLSKDIISKESEPNKISARELTRQRLERQGLVRRRTSATRIDAGPTSIKDILNQ